MSTPMKLDLNRDCIENYYKNFQEIVINTSSSELKKNKIILEETKNLFKKLH